MGVVVGNMQGPGQGGSFDPATRLVALRTFEQICAQASPDSPELARGVAAVAKFMSGAYEEQATNTTSVELAVRAVQVLRGASEHSACRAAIVERGCGALMDLLLGDTANSADPRVDSRRLVADVLLTLRSIGLDGPHCAAAAVAAGGIFALANSAASESPQQGDQSIELVGLATAAMGDFARHPQCRTPILECGAATGASLISFYFHFVELLDPL
jgi:hypothetical protein